MKITNKHGLPKAFVDYATADRYSKGNADISVTSLIDSPRVRLLKDRHSNDLESDAADMIWPLLGTAVHNILEQSTSTGNVVKEERLFMEVQGWTLSGAIDHQEIVDNVDPVPVTSSEFSLLSRFHCVETADSDERLR